MSCKRVFPLFLLFLLIGVVACGSDESPAPAVRFDFGELRTDAAGHAQRFTPDGERERAIVAAGTSVFRADTAFRAIVSYVPAEGGIRPMQILPVPVHFPQNIPSFRFKADPVRLIAAWRGGRYLNLRLGLPGRFGEKHALAFDRRPTVEWPDGHRTAVLRLHHEAQSAHRDYLQDTYLNLALSPYLDAREERFDSVAVYVRTFEGTLRRAFAL